MEMVFIVHSTVQRGGIFFEALKLYKTKYFRQNILGIISRIIGKKGQQVIDIPERQLFLAINIVHIEHGSEYKMCIWLE